MTATAADILPFRRSWRRAFQPAKLWLGCQRLNHQCRLMAQWWLQSQTPYQPLFVLATHRSGSNLLMDYINRLDGVQCHSELLCRELPYGLSPRQLRPSIALRHLRRSLHTLSSPIRGCKLMLDQLDDCGLALEALDAAFPEAKYLILYRQSLAEQYLSRESAKATDQWILLDGQKPKQARVHLDAAHFQAYCSRLRRRYREILDQAWLPERSVLLSYEELTEDPSSWLDGHICPLLGVPTARPETSLRKQNTQPLEQRVANYRQVAPLLHSPLCRQHYSWRERRPVRRAA